jgi:hypothetical protein
MIRKLPVPPALVNVTYEFETSTLRQMWKDSNLATPGSISEICFRLVNLRAVIADKSSEDPAAIRERAFSIDADLEDWKVSAGIRWTYDELCAASSTNSTLFMGKYHRYANLWIARAWLNFRVMRIAVNQIIIENAVKFEFADEIVSRARYLVRDLSSEICISISSFDDSPRKYCI